MTKEVEVGDEFTGKVVKTTTFGAFVELAKGTDGLLHISNVSPGQRVDTVEDVLNKGDEIEVRVVEVDRERGRIGLRLADDPAIAGKSVEELAALSPPAATAAARGDRGDRGGARRRDRERAAARGAGRPRQRRRGRDRDRRPPPARRRAVDEHRLTELGLGRAGRHGAHALRALRRARASGSAPARPPRTSPRPGSRTCSSTCCSAARRAIGSLEIDQIFDAMGAELNAGTGKETTSVYSRVLDAPPRAGVRGDGRHGLAPARSTATSSSSEREIVLEEIAMYEDDPQDKVFDVLGEAVFGDHPLGRAIIGRAEVVGAARRLDALARASTPRATCPATSSSRRPGSVDHDALVALVERRRHRARRRARRPPCPPPDGAAAARVRFERKDTEQYHVCLGAPGHRPRRRAPLRAARARQHPRRDVVLAAVPGGPRARGLAYSVYSFSSAVRRHRARSASTSARGRTTSAARAAASSADELERLRARAASRAEELAARQGERQGPRRAVARVHHGAHEPPRLVRAGRTCRCCPSTSWSSASTRYARRRRRAGRASCSTPARLSRRRDRRPTRRSSAPRWSRCSRGRWPRA